MQEFILKLQMPNGKLAGLPSRAGEEPIDSVKVRKNGVDSAERKERIPRVLGEKSLMEPALAQYTAYQLAFNHFNEKLFGNGLPACMLSFSRRRSSSHTLFTSELWHEKAGPVTPEISLNLKQLGEGALIEATATLVREMVHLWQEKYGHPSCKGYYNREWAKKMATIGLIPTATGLPGGKRTGKGLKHYIEANGQFELAFQQMPKSCLWPFLPAAIEGGKNKGYSEKEMYQCPGCGIKVWGKGGLGLVCECGGVLADKSGEAKPGVEEKVCLILMKKRVTSEFPEAEKYQQK